MEVNLKKHFNQIMDHPVLDYIPVVNVGSNIKILVEKCIHQKELKIDHVNNRHIQNVKRKSIARCVLVPLTPIVSIPVLIFIDISNYCKKKKTAMENLRLDLFETTPTFFVNEDINKSLLDNIQNDLGPNEYTPMLVMRQGLIELPGNSTLGNDIIHLVITKEHIYSWYDDEQGSVYLCKLTHSDHNYAKFISKLAATDKWSIDEFVESESESKVENYQEFFQFIGLENPSRVNHEGSKSLYE